MAIYLSAGHHDADPGAPAADGSNEAKMTKELRDLVVSRLRKQGAKVIIDDDRETLQQYLNRIQPGSGSVVCDIHFNAAANKTASGVEVLIPSPRDANETRLSAWEQVYAASICHDFKNIMGIPDRGVKDEKKSARGSLALMREDGINLLVEVCFISNPSDLTKYHANKNALADSLAKILLEADAKFT